MKLVEKESRPRIMQLQPFWTKSTSFQILGQWLIMLILTKTVGWSTQVRSQVASGQLLLPQSLLLLSSSAGNSLPTSFQAWWLLLHGWKPLKQAEEVEKIWRNIYISIRIYIYTHIIYPYVCIYIYAFCIFLPPSCSLASFSTSTGRSHDHAFSHLLVRHDHVCTPTSLQALG